jgi:hypothetical protein
MSYLYVLSPTLALVGFGVFDVAKIHIFPDMKRKKSMRQPPIIIIIFVAMRILGNGFKKHE